CLQFKSFPYSF
nr:immunoglobulin light chain junction region [Macaca mulatta]